MGYSEITNIIRVLMGLPPTYTMYEGVSPSNLIQVAIKMIIAVVILFWLFKTRNNRKD